MKQFKEVVKYPKNHPLKNTMYQYCTVLKLRTKLETRLSLSSSYPPPPPKVFRNLGKIICESQTVRIFFTTFGGRKLWESDLVGTMGAVKMWWVRKKEGYIYISIRKCWKNSFSQSWIHDIKKVGFLCCFLSIARRFLLLILQGSSLETCYKILVTIFWFYNDVFFSLSFSEEIESRCGL